jgi:hypothetical protein
LKLQGMYNCGMVGDEDLEFFSDELNEKISK